MRYRRTVLILLITAFSILLVTIYILPSKTPYSPYNRGGDGYSHVVRFYNASIISGGIPEDTSDSLIIIPITVNESDITVPGLEKLICQNNILLIMDEGGLINRQLSEVGLSVSVTNKSVLDEIDKVGDRFHPRAYTVFSSGDRTVVYMDAPRVVRFTRDQDVLFLLNTGRFSFVDLNNDTLFNIGEPMGNETVGVGVEKCNSLIIVVGDVDFVSNGLLRWNEMFINSILGKRAVNNTYLVVDYIPLSISDRIKIMLETLLPVRAGGRESLSLLGFALSTLIVLVMMYGRWRIE